MKSKGRITLENGLQIFYKKSPSKILSAVLEVGAGSCREPSNARGLAHLVEHVGFNGTRRYRTIRALMNAAADYGFIPNASTSFKYVKYPYDAFVQDIAPATAIVADIAFAPLINEASVKKEKKIVLHEYVRSQDSSSFHENKLFNKVFFHGTPAKILVIGIPAHIYALQASTVRDFHSNYCVPANSRLFIIGAIEENTLRNLGKILEQYPGGNPATQMTMSLRPLLNTEHHEEKTSFLRQSYGCIAFRTPCFATPDEPAIAYINSLLAGRGKSSLLEIIREQRHLAYATGSQLFDDTEIGYLAPYFECASGKLEICRELTLHAISTLNPDEREIAAIRKSFEKSVASDQNNPVKQFNAFINEELYGIHLGPYNKRLLAVSKKDILNARDKYLRGPYQSMVLVGSK